MAALNSVYILHLYFAETGPKEPVQTGLRSLGLEYLPWRNEPEFSKDQNQKSGSEAGIVTHVPQRTESTKVCISAKDDTGGYCSVVCR